MHYYVQVPGNFEITCNYYFRYTFNSKLESYKEYNVLSMFYLNFQSLASKYMSFQDYIIKRILFFTKIQNNRLGGGVCLCIDSNLNYKERPDISFGNDDINSLFIELQLTSQKNVIVGVIYKAPNSDGKSFNDLLDKCLSAISKENRGGGGNGALFCIFFYSTSFVFLSEGGGPSSSFFCLKSKINVTILVYPFFLTRGRAWAPRAPGSAPSYYNVYHLDILFSPTSSPCTWCSRWHKKIDIWVPYRFYVFFLNINASTQNIILLFPFLFP